MDPDWQYPPLSSPFPVQVSPPIFSQTPLDPFGSRYRSMQFDPHRTLCQQSSQVRVHAAQDEHSRCDVVLVAYLTIKIKGEGKK